MLCLTEMWYKIDFDAVETFAVGAIAGVVLVAAAVVDAAAVGVGAVTAAADGRAVTGQMGQLELERVRKQLQLPPLQHEASVAAPAGYGFEEILWLQVE